MDLLNQEWHVIANSEDIPFRHVYQSRLNGQELAVWRDYNGDVNVWENRCPHRGVRLTLGENVGDQLQCQYHGWKYQSGTGHCSFVPAHRTTQPSNACVKTYLCAELEGLIFVKLDTTNGTDAPKQLSLVDSLNSSNLRSQVIAVDAQTAIDTIKKGASSFATVLGNRPEEIQFMDDGLTIVLTCTGLAEALRIFVQPESEQKVVVHARLYTDTPVALQRKVMFMHVLTELFAQTELSTSISDSKNIIATDSSTHVKLGNPEVDSARKQIICTVIARNTETPDIDSFWLKPEEDQVLTLEPGMHVGLTTPSGHLRQYSIVNTPEERDVLVIGVKLEANSRGGSRSMHSDVRVGSKVSITLPRNQFQLQPSERKAVLIAGGIGVTPLLAMALFQEQRDRTYHLHYFVRGNEHIAFKDRISALGNNCSTYIGLGIEETQSAITELLQELNPESHDIYVCGPQAMIELVSTTAIKSGFSADQVYYEYFGLTDHATSRALSEGSYQVTIQSTGQEFTVEPGRSLLQACLEAGVEIDYSCEQGVCGACMTKVISGDLQHEDVYLSSKEKIDGKLIMPCVSSCKSAKLVLDI